MNFLVEKKILVRTSFRGTHNWPEASQIAGKQVQFLEHEHRHTFHILVELEVTDSDREVEFFILQEQVDGCISSLYEEVGLVRQVGRRSCEMVAEEIIGVLREEGYTDNIIAVEVWEDNEVGGRVTSYPNSPETVTPLSDWNN